MTKDEALDLALEALEYYDKPRDEYSAKVAREQDKKAITAIKQALAAPVQEPVDSMGMPLSCGKPFCAPGDHHPLCKLAAQPAPVQPVAWLRDPKHYPAEDKIMPHVTWEKERLNTTPLYTTPPAAQRQWVGLTDKEKQEWVELMPDELKPRHIMNLINVIEVELKEKNT
jgi:hypothetical protein